MHYLKSSFFYKTNIFKKDVKISPCTIQYLNIPALNPCLINNEIPMTGCKWIKHLWTEIWWLVCRQYLSLVLSSIFSSLTCRSSTVSRGSIPHDIGMNISTSSNVGTQWVYFLKWTWTGYLRLYVLIEWCLGFSLSFLKAQTFFSGLRPCVINT